MPKINKRVSSLLVLMVGVGATASATQTADTVCPDTALTAVAQEVATLFHDRDVVFLGSTHGGRKLHDIAVCILAQPKLWEYRPAVLVEFATAAHQPLMDRYLLDLDAVPVAELRPAWFDTASPDLWATLPQVPAFFRAVRRINEGLSTGARLRVIGGNAPVTWETVETAEDLAAYPFKTNFAAHVITDHFIQTADAKLLVMYGEAHNHYGGGTLMSEVLAYVPRDRLFVVGTIVDARHSDRRTLAQFAPSDRPFFVPVDQLGLVEDVPADLFYVDGSDLGRFIDAVLYLGPEPDEDLRGVLALSDADRLEIAQRREIGSHPDMLELRLARRERWFERHPIVRHPGRQ